MSNVAGFVGFCETKCKDYLVFPANASILKEFAAYFACEYSDCAVLDSFECVETTVEKNTRASGRLRMSLIELD